MLQAAWDPHKVVDLPLVLPTVPETVSVPNTVFPVYLPALSKPEPRTQTVYRGSSLIGKTPLVGPYSRPVSRVQGGF